QWTPAVRSRTSTKRAGRPRRFNPPVRTRVSRGTATADKGCSLRNGSGGAERSGRTIGVGQDTARHATRPHQGEAARRNTAFEQPFPGAEDDRKDPEAMLVDEIRGDQRLEQAAAAPKMELRTGRGLQPAEFGHDVAADALRCLPRKILRPMRDHI